MRCVAGSIYRPGEGLSDGWLLVDAGHVVDEGEGRPPRPPDARGLVLPAPVNAHTHVGDITARGVDVASLTLSEVFAPPEGLKHRLLRERPPTLATMRGAADEVAASGAGTFVDFREGGADGAQLLRMAAPHAIIFGRCAAAWDEAEAARVIEFADGLALSAMKDVPAGVPEAMAAFSRKRGKRFAMHLSEDAREDVARAIALRPDFVVHCVQATRTDLDALSGADVPIVVCPRSNARFGALPDVRAMIEAGVTIALGSDNAMLQSLDVLDDARFLVERGIPRDALLDAAIAGGARVAGGTSAPESWLRAGDAARFVTLPAGDALAKR